MDIFYPIQLFANWFTYRFLHLEKGTTFDAAVNFFIYDSIKIFTLLGVIIFIVSFLRSYLPPEKTKRILSTRFEIVGNILAALIGIVTPFCSCSAVPLFIGMVESGVPLGVTFSYLISAPMVNEVAAVLLIGLFGINIAILYIVSGVTIAIVAGFIIGHLHVENLVKDYVWKIKVNSKITLIDTSVSEKMVEAFHYTKDLVRKVFPYVLVGVAAGALVHGYAPENFLTRFVDKDDLFAVPLSILIGVPLYSNAAGTIPIVKSLIEKGLPIGTALAFMMSVTALSFPEMIILRKVLKAKLLAIYITILTAGIVFTGYLFNFAL